MPTGGMRGHSPSPMNLKRLTRGPILWIVLAVVILWTAASMLVGTGVQQIDTSDGLKLLSEGKVQQAQLVDVEQRVSLTLSSDFTTNGVDKGKNVEFYYIAPQGPDVVAAVTSANLPKGYNSTVPTTPTPCSPHQSSSCARPSRPRYAPSPRSSARSGSSSRSRA